MKNKLLAIFATGLLAVPMAASATPIDYAIMFTTTSGAPDVSSGSFTYDAATGTFSNFLVNWNGISFGLTGSANSPVDPSGLSVGCGNIVGGYLAFALLEQSSCLSADRFYWTATNQQGVIAEFVFSASPATNNNGNLAVHTVLRNYTEPDGSAIGVYSIVATVPEPATLGLMGLGLVGLGFARRRKNA